MKGVSDLLPHSRLIEQVERTTMSRPALTIRIFESSGGQFFRCSRLQFAHESIRIAISGYNRVNMVAPHMEREQSPLLLLCKCDDRITHHLTPSLIKKIWSLNHRIPFIALSIDIGFKEGRGISIMIAVNGALALFSPVQPCAIG